MGLTDRIKAILLDELKLETVSDDAKQEHYTEWDSLAYLGIIGALEEEFGIQITPENINNFNSIPNIVKEITKCKKQ